MLRAADGADGRAYAGLRRARRRIRAVAAAWTCRAAGPAELHRRLADRARRPTDRSIFTNGIDARSAQARWSRERIAARRAADGGARGGDLASTRKPSRWRHDRPKVASIGGPPPSAVYKNVGDPVASGLAVANGVVYFTAVASGRLVALNATTGSVLKEIEVGPVWVRSFSLTRPRLRGQRATRCSVRGATRRSFPRITAACCIRSGCRAKMRSVGSEGGRSDFLAGVAKGGATWGASGGFSEICRCRE